MRKLQKSHLEQIFKNQAKYVSRRNTGFQCTNNFFLMGNIINSFRSTKQNIRTTRRKENIYTISQSKELHRVSALQPQPMAHIPSRHPTF